MKVRNVLAGAAIVAATLAWSAPKAWADPFSVSITIDENGHGQLTNTNGFFSPLSFGTTGDSGPGGLSSVLFYDLLNPPGLTTGDLVLLEPGRDAPSDVIRFFINPLNQQGQLFFYSDNLDGVDALADTGLPTAFSTNVVRLFEVGPEDGPNGLAYTPTSGQPGFVTGAAGPVTYNIISDAAVPEPSSLLLLGTGVAAAALWRRRRARSK